MGRHVFISHSSKDAKAVAAVIATIEARGYPCWLASRDVRGNYMEDIVTAIRESCAVILIFSENANRSQEVMKEMSLASKNNTPIIPIRIRDILPSGGFEYPLSVANWIDLFRNREQAFDNVIARLKALEEPVDPPVARPPAADRRFLGLKGPLALALVAGLGVCIGVGIVAYRRLTYDMRFDYSPAGPESTDSRVNSFSIHIIRGSGPPEKRVWTRVASDRWRESYGAGGVESKTVRRMILANCPGTVVAEMGSDEKYAFIPDRGCPDMVFRISHGGRNTGWGVASDMDDVR